MSQYDKGRGWVRRSIDRSGDAAADAAGREEKRGPIVGIGTFIDQGVEFVGTLRLDGPFRIDSEFCGEIICCDTVIVGEAAGIEADIHAREVVISGAVAGNVTASRQLTIRSTGRLHGDAEAPSLEIEKGAIFNGRTTMVRPEPAARVEKTSSEDAMTPPNLHANDVARPPASSHSDAANGA
jgi:cytoskeletal protein CcmA (bactofilin family)